MRLLTYSFAIVLITSLTLVSCNKDEEEHCSETRTFWFDGSIADAQFESSKPCAPVSLDFTYAWHQVYGGAPADRFGLYYLTYQLLDNKSHLGELTLAMALNIAPSLIDTTYDANGNITDSEVPFKNIPQLFENKVYQVASSVSEFDDTINVGVTFSDGYGSDWYPVENSTNYFRLNSYEGVNTVNEISGIEYSFHMYVYDFRILVASKLANDTIAIEGLWRVGLR